MPIPQALANAAARAAIPRRQLVALCGYSVVIWSLGNGVLPLLPKVAASFHEDPTAIGLYLASSYAAIAVGAAAAGWLADHVTHRRRLMLAVGLAGAPVVALTSAVTEFWQLVGLTAVVWWLGGTALALTNIAGGLSAGPMERGRVLGILATMAPVGSILGGLGIGALADSLGYARMWAVLGAFWLLCPAAGLFVLEVTPPPKVGARPAPAMGGLTDRGFLLLLACGGLGAVGSFVGSLGRTLAMQSYSDAALTSTVVASGIVTLPFPLMLGMLSDRLGRLRFLGLCYAAGVAGLVVYSAASSLAGFWLASSLVAFVAYVAPGVGSALVVDLVDRPAVARGLALFGAMGWIGGIVGFAGGGYAFQHIGYPSGFLLGGAVTAAGIALLQPIAIALRHRRGRGGERDFPAGTVRKG